MTTEQIRTIDMGFTWAQAAQIIAAALEHGTGEGKAAARKELQRMASILDAINHDQNSEATE